MSGIHAFNIDLALQYGLEESILIEHFIFWDKYYSTNHDKSVSKGHYHNNQYWIYNSITAWHSQYPYMTPAVIKRSLRNLEIKGIIKTGNFNKISYDRTKWYSLNKNFPFANNQKPLANFTNGTTDFTNGKSQNHQPIPVTNQLLTSYLPIKINKKNETTQEHASAKASPTVSENQIKNKHIVDNIISYWENETHNQVSVATKKQVIPLINKVLKDFDANDCQDVIDYIITSEYHISNGCTGLLHIFRATKFAEKLERAKLKQPILNNSNGGGMFANPTRDMFVIGKRK